jgi:GMP synthase (glutamine-hydrolysing)
VRVLSVVHHDSPTGGGGLFERVVIEQGAHLERWYTANGDPPPEAPGAWAAIMVFGGVMHPDQDAEHEWLAGETAFIQSALDTGVPILGVCLGAQLVARAAGARVGPARAPEVGWHEVELTDAAADDPVLGVLPPRITAFQWHYYGFDVPDGAVELASSPAASQAYRLGDRAWGVQFHPEVDRAMLDDWFAEGGGELGKPIEAVEEETDRHLGTWNEQGKALCSAFLDAASGSAQPFSAGSSAARDHSCQDPG